MSALTLEEVRRRQDTVRMMRRWVAIAAVERIHAASLPQPECAALDGAAKQEAPPVGSGEASTDHQLVAGVSGGCCLHGKA